MEDDEEIRYLRAHAGNPEHWTRVDARVDLTGRTTFEIRLPDQVVDYLSERAAREHADVIDLIERLITEIVTQNTSAKPTVRGKV